MFVFVLPVSVLLFFYGVASFVSFLLLLCYDMFCSMLLFSVVLCYVASCSVMFCCVTFRYDMLCYETMYYDMT